MVFSSNGQVRSTSLDVSIWAASNTGNRKIRNRMAIWYRADELYGYRCFHLLGQLLRHVRLFDKVQYALSAEAPGGLYFIKAAGYDHRHGRIDGLDALIRFFAAHDWH